jgi:hypothetical protein
MRLSSHPTKCVLRFAVVQELDTGTALATLDLVWLQAPLMPTPTTLPSWPTSTLTTHRVHVFVEHEHPLISCVGGPSVDLRVH